MAMLLAILFFLVTAILLTLGANRFIQRLFPITEEQTADHRYACELLANLAVIATFAAVTVTFVGGNLCLGYVHW